MCGFKLVIALIDTTRSAQNYQILNKLNVKLHDLNNAQTYTSRSVDEQSWTGI